MSSNQTVWKISCGNKTLGYTEDIESHSQEYLDGNRKSIVQKAIDRGHIRKDSEIRFEMVSRPRPELSKGLIRKGRDVFLKIVRKGRAGTPHRMSKSERVLLANLISYGLVFSEDGSYTLKDPKEAEEHYSSIL